MRRARVQTWLGQQADISKPNFPPGTSFWAEPLWHALEPFRQLRGAQARAIKTEVFCCGTLPEAFIAKVSS
jgi:hypothetical protein